MTAIASFKGPAGISQTNTNAYWRLSGPVLAFAIILVSFLFFRPKGILFTASDAVFILGGIILLAGNGFTLRPFGVASFAWFIALSLLLTGLLISTLINGVPTRWAPVAAQYLFSFAFLPMILMQQNKMRWLLYAKALIVGVILLEVSAGVLYFYYDGSYQELSRFGIRFWSGAGRLGSFIGNPNFNAAMIGMTLPFLLYFKQQRLISLPLFLGALGILLTALVFTASASGLFASILGVTIFGIVSGGAFLFRLALIGAIALFAILFFDVQLPNTFQERIGGAIEAGNIEEAGSFSDRYALITEAWSIARQTHLIGLGVDQFRVQSIHEAPVHNSYLLIWTEGGLLAFFGWIGMLLLLASGPASALLNGRRGIAALGFAVFAVFCLFTMSSTHMYGRAWITPVLIALAPAFAASSAGGWRRSTPSKGM